MVDRTDVEIVGAALPAWYHSTSFMEISRRCPRRYPVSPLLAKARGKGSASRRHAVARLWFALWPVGGRCVSACSAGASLTPGAGAVTASGCLVTRPRHEPCCGCATASTPLASSSWLRFLPSLLLSKGRKETSWWEGNGNWERFVRAGLVRPLIPECWNTQDREFPLLPAIEGGAGETTTIRRMKRNAGRQRSRSNRRDMGHSKSFPISRRVDGPWHDG